MARFLLSSVLALTIASPALAVEKADVIETYANIAEATYGDSLLTAQRLQGAVDALIAQPSPANLDLARKAWRAARIPYQQSEVFRFGNPIVDDWEGGLNSWPLDEGLIDYVDASYGGASDENAFAELNVIANPVFNLSGTQVDATNITPNLIRETLHEADGNEANVASGYHAIEFLLWGQDLNGTKSGSGARSWTDYAQGEACTNQNCDRRGDYLKAATDLLVTDLEYMVAQWGTQGAARTTLFANEDAAISAMLTGMGSLSYGELAGERMRLGLMLNDPEEEEDCFSDNTHNSHYYDGLGIQNVYLGTYSRADGTLITGPSLSDLVAADNADLDIEMQMKLSDTMRNLGQIKTAAEAGMAYDQMLARANKGGEALIMGGVNALIAQTKTIERIVATLKLENVAIEGSDSLNTTGAVFQ
tara:strand:- start:17879 stop:19138 length:1260 start_codon:yes stop_codon:yes gene_type:complete